MKQYRVCTLDVTADNEINDAHSTSDVVELSESPTVSEVCKALKGCERMASDWPEKNVQLEEDGDDYFVCDKRGKKVYQLRYEG